MKYFKETQQFRQAWLYIPIIVALIFFLVLAVRQVYWDEPMGSNPAPDWMLGLILLLQLGILALFWYARLETEIDERGVTVRFFPFLWKPRFFAREDILDIQVRKYKPLQEYGGWGLRYSLRSGRAYNVSGNNGIQIVLKNGKRVLIGTQDPEEVKRVIENLKIK
jgi:hypothetical protein